MIDRILVPLDGSERAEAVLFTVGSMRGLVVCKRWPRCGFEVVIIGSIAAAVACGVGMALRGMTT